MKTQSFAVSLATVLMVASPSVLTTGCSQEPFEVSATTSITRVGGIDVLQIDVLTKPKANVRINDSTYAQSWSATADATGHAIVKVNLPEPLTVLPKPPVPQAPSYTGPSYPTYGSPVAPVRSVLYGPEIKLNVSADFYEPRKLFKSRYKSAQTQVTATRAPAVRFDPTTRQIACLGKTCTGTFSLYREARVDFTDIEPLATADLAGSQARTVTRQMNLTLDMKPYLEKVPLGDFFKPYPMGNVDLPLELGFSDGVKLKTNVNVPANLLKPALGEVLGKVSQGAVRFPGEEAAPGNRTSLLFLPREQLYGKAEKVRDLDLVAVATDKDRTECGAEAIVDADVVVYERRTGKSIGQKRFVAPNCKTDYDDAAVEAWVRTFVKSE